MIQPLDEGARGHTRVYPPGSSHVSPFHTLRLRVVSMAQPGERSDPRAEAACSEGAAGSGSVKAQARLTGRETSRAGGKPGLSDPVQVYGNCIAQRIKGTPGITG